MSYPSPVGSPVFSGSIGHASDPVDEKKAPITICDGKKNIPSEYIGEGVSVNVNGNENIVVTNNTGIININQNFNDPNKQLEPVYEFNGSFTPEWHQPFMQDPICITSSDEKVRMTIYRLGQACQSKGASDVAGKTINMVQNILAVHLNDDSISDIKANSLSGFLIAASDKVYQINTTYFYNLFIANGLNDLADVIKDVANTNNFKPEELKKIKFDFSNKKTSINEVLGDKNPNLFKHKLSQMLGKNPALLNSLAYSTLPHGTASNCGSAIEVLNAMLTRCTSARHLQEVLYGFKAIDIAEYVDNEYAKRKNRSQPI